MEMDIQKIENRIRGTGLTVDAFLKEVSVPRSTWSSWKTGAQRPLERWVMVVAAVDKLEDGAA